MMVLKEIRIGSSAFVHPLLVGLCSRLDQVPNYVVLVLDNGVRSSYMGPMNWIKEVNGFDFD